MPKSSCTKSTKVGTKDTKIKQSKHQKNVLELLKKGS